MLEEDTDAAGNATTSCGRTAYGGSQTRRFYRTHVNVSVTDSCASEKANVRSERMSESGMKDASSSGGYLPEAAPVKHPLFQWPPNPAAASRYLFGWPGFFWPYQAVFFAIALIWWALLTPQLSVLRNPSLGWIVPLFARNLLLVLLVAGGLHVRLYMKKAQGTEYKYSQQWPIVDSSTFLFRDQVWDNAFWSLFSGVPVWTAYEALTLWLYANGFAPMVSWNTSSVYCSLLLLLTPLWMDVHFSVTHRMLHWKPLFKGIHSLHHNNFNPGPWSGLAMHPIEHVIFFSAVMLFWVIPSHPLHSQFILLYLVLGDIAGHHGFDRLVLSKGRTLDASHHMHFLHHKHVRVNYGNGLLPFDRWFGTFHDGSEAATKELRSRFRARAVGSSSQKRETRA